MQAYTLSAPGKAMSTVDSFALAYQLVSTSSEETVVRLSPVSVDRYQSQVVSLGHLLATVQPPIAWVGSRCTGISRLEYGRRARY